MEISPAELALLLLSRLAVRQVAEAAQVFPVSLQLAHLNAVRQSHLSFFAKKVPCVRRIITTSVINP